MNDTLEKQPFRAHARRSVRLAATVAQPIAGWQREANVVDVGLGGACIELDRVADGVPVIAGERVTLSFMTPTLWDPLSIPAKVAWSNAGRVGVAFEHASPASVLALFELISTLAFEA